MDLNDFCDFVKDNKQYIIARYFTSNEKKKLFQCSETEQMKQIIDN